MIFDTETKRDNPNALTPQEEAIFIFIHDALQVEVDKQKPSTTREARLIAYRTAEKVANELGRPDLFEGIYEIYRDVVNKSIEMTMRAMYGGTRK